jgi:hypothetical protein
VGEKSAEATLSRAISETWNGRAAPKLFKVDKEVKWSDHYPAVRAADHAASPATQLQNAYVRSRSEAPEARG